MSLGLTQRIAPQRPFAGRQAVDGGDVDALLGEPLEMVGERPGAVVALDQEAGLLRIEPELGLPRGHVELARVVRHHVDLGAAAARKSGAGEQVDARAHQRGEHLERLPGRVGNRQREVVHLAHRVSHRPLIWTPPGVQVFRLWRRQRQGVAVLYPAYDAGRFASRP